MVRKRIDARQKIRGLDVDALEQVVHGDFHEHDCVLVLRRSRHELPPRAFEHIEVQVVYRPECAPLDEHGLLVEDLGRLRDLAIDGKHHRLGHPCSTSCRLIRRLSTLAKPGPENLIMSTSMRLLVS